jgi:hypothetical protein
VHRLYFEPEYPEFSARTMWSLSNAFTSAFKKLDPIPPFKATAKPGELMNQPTEGLVSKEVSVQLFVMAEPNLHSPALDCPATEYSPSEQEPPFATMR